MARPRYQHEGLSGWAQEGKLSTGSNVFRGGARAVTMQAKLKQEDSLTTQFNLASDQAVPNCRAEIVSTVGGISVRRLITVVDGATITTRGGSVEVTVRDYTAGGISSGLEYSVSILATLGVRATFKQPPYISPLVYDEIAPVPSTNNVIAAAIPVAATTGEVEIAVPEDAGVVSLFVSMTTPGAVAAANSMIVEQRIGAVIFQTYDSRDYDWVPIYPGVDIIRLRNTSAVEASAMLFFGIDG